MRTLCYKKIAAISMAIVLAGKGIVADERARLVINTEGVRGSWVTALDISNDRQWIAAADGETVRIWRASDQRLWSTLRGYSEGPGLQTGTINALAFSKDSQFLVVGVSDNTSLGSTRVYSLRNPDKMHRLLEGHSGCTSGVAFSNDGQTLATWSCDGTMIVSHWNADEGSCTPIMQVDMWNDARTVSSLPFSFFGFPYDNNWLVHANGTSVQLISIRDRSALRDFETAPEVLRSLFIDNGKRPFLSPITGASLSQEILNRVCPECGAIAAAKAAAERTESTPIESLLDVGGFRVGTQTLLAIGGSTTRVKDTTSRYWIGIWNERRRDHVAEYSGHQFFPTAISVNQANGLVASADALGEIHIWDFQTQKTVYVIRSYSPPLYRVHWGEDNDRIYFSNSHHPQAKYVHNAYGPVTHQFSVNSRHIRSSELRLSDEYFPQLLDEFGKAVSELKSKPGSGVLGLFALDGNQKKVEVASFSLRDFRVELEGDSPTAYAFLPRENVAFNKAPIVCGTKRGRLLQLGLDSERRLVVKREFIGHDATITSLAFSPDGNRMVSCGFDGTIRFWDLDTPRILGDLDAQIYGNMVVSVPPGSKAEIAGLRPRDRIVAFGDNTYYERIRTHFAGGYRPGQKVLVTWNRSSERSPTPLDTSRIRDTSEMAMRKPVELTPSADMVEPQLTLFVSKDQEWVIWDRQGHYDSSPQGSRFIGWHVNRERHEPAEFYGAAQFRDTLYQPRQIDEALRQIGMDVVKVPVVDVAESSPLVPMPSRLEPSGLGSKELPKKRPELVPPPQTKFVKPNSLATTSEEEIDVEAEVSTPLGHALKDVVFRVNGRQSPQNYSLLAEDQDDQRITIRIGQRLRLDPGTNEIELFARHGSSTSSTSRLLIERKVASEMKSVILPNLYVLAIGVSKYRSSGLNLKHADHDAAEFVAACENMKGDMYGEIECKLFVNDQATSEQIRQGMGWLYKAARDPRDVAILFIAGHGAYDEFSNWFFAPHNIDLQNLQGTAIFMDEFRALLEKKIGAGKKIVLVDTCHAGGVGGQRTLQTLNPTGRDPWREQEIFYLISCIDQETAEENDQLGHGVFTYALLETMQTPAADINQDGEISFLEAEIYLARRVPELTGDRQHPSGQKPLNVRDQPFFRIKPKP